MSDAETKLEGYFAAYPPAQVALGKALRARLRARLPGLSEIVYVYENQGALVLTYSPSEHGYEGVCSLAVYEDRVLLHLAQGASLKKADPEKLLRGSGKTVRHVVLGSVEDYDRPAVQALLTAAVELAGVRPDANATGAVIIRAEEQKRRARR